MSGTWPIWRRHPLQPLSSCIHEHHWLYIMKCLPVSFVQLKNKLNKSPNRGGSLNYESVGCSWAQGGMRMCCCSWEDQVFFFFLCSVYVSLFVAVVPKFVQNFSVQKVWGTVARVAFTCGHEVCFKKKQEATKAWLWKWWKLIKHRCLYIFFLSFLNLSVCIITARALCCFCAYNWICAATGSCIQRQHFDHICVVKLPWLWGSEHCEVGLAQFEIYSLI